VKSTLIIFIIIIFVNTTVSNQVFGQPQTSPPTLISDAAIIIDAKTGKVLFEKESHTKMYPASLTKIATAIYAIEKGDRKSTRLNSSHVSISYAVFCLKKKKRYISSTGRSSSLFN